MSGSRSGWTAPGPHSGWTATVGAGSALAALGTVHALTNVRRLRRPRPTGTAEAAVEAAGGDPRIRVVRGDGDPPPGWLGKPAACQRLADLAGRDADVLVFLHADVRLAPHALAAAVDLLDHVGLDLVSPWPRQVAESAAERLMQPLQQWSWLTTLPCAPRNGRGGRRCPRPTASSWWSAPPAAWRAGGHRAVADQVMEDLALLRAVKRTGGSGVAVDGSTLANCRIYTGAA